MSYKQKTPFLVICLVALPVEALAHASEQGLVMLLPTELYTLGGTYYQINIFDMNTAITIHTLN